jgi:PKHD-type hydroxylase
VLLTDPDTFDGGDLEFSGKTFDAARVQGTVTVFPSFIPHKVTPMEHGVRHVVVGWVLGPTFV